MTTCPDLNLQSQVLTGMSSLPRQTPKIFLSVSSGITQLGFGKRQEETNGLSLKFTPRWGFLFQTLKGGKIGILAIYPKNQRETLESRSKTPRTIPTTPNKENKTIQTEEQEQKRSYTFAKIKRWYEE